MSKKSEDPQAAQAGTSEGGWGGQVLLIYDSFIMRDLFGYVVPGYVLLWGIFGYEFASGLDKVITVDLKTLERSANGSGVWIAIAALMLASYGAGVFLRVFGTISRVLVLHLNCGMLGNPWKTVEYQGPKMAKRASTAAQAKMETATDAETAAQAKMETAADAEAAAQAEVKEAADAKAETAAQAKVKAAADAKAAAQAEVEEAAQAMTRMAAAMWYVTRWLWRGPESASVRWYRSSYRGQRSGGIDRSIAREAMFLHFTGQMGLALVILGALEIAAKNYAACSVLTFTGVVFLAGHYRHANQMRLLRKSTELNEGTL